MKQNLLIIFMLFPFIIFSQTKIIHVSNAEQFVDAIGSDRIIILSADTFRLRDIAELKKFPLDTEGFSDVQIREHVSYSAGWGIGIIGVHNLTIVGDTNSKTPSLLSTSDEGDEIMTFSDCSGISIRHINAVHLLVVPGGCNGGVLFFNRCKNSTIKNCTLSGCGTIGILCDDDSNLVCTDCVITHCSEGLFELNRSKHLLFQNCLFTKIIVGRSMIELTDCADLHFVQCMFSDNKTDTASEFYTSPKNSVFSFYEDTKGKDIVLDNCTFSGNDIFTMTNRNDLLVRKNIRYIKNDNLNK